jgi:histone H4
MSLLPLPCSLTPPTGQSAHPQPSAAHPSTGGKSPHAVQNLSLLRGYGGKSHYGLGKGGLGKGGARRHKKVLRDTVQGITKNDIRRLARRGGVVRLSAGIYDHTRTYLSMFLSDIIKDAYAYCDHAQRKTISALDIVYALKRHGRQLYGFGF